MAIFLGHGEINKKSCLLASLLWTLKIQKGDGIDDGAIA
jgi:hypothetical protein